MAPRHVFIHHFVSTDQTDTICSYTCAARWHTCDCTEDDHRRRQTEIEARRLQRDRQIQKEAAEIAEALAQIERMEREEAMERERRGQEQRRKEEEELRDKEMKRMMHIAATLRGLRTALSSINKYQQTLLNKRHEKTAHSLHSRTTAGTSVVEQQRDKLLEGIRTNQKQRMDQLIVSQKAEFDSMIARHEEEEDDTLLTVSRHLKRKTNRESREKAILDKLEASQESERRGLEQSHRQAILTQEQNNNLELKALEAGLARDYTSTRETELDTSKLTQMVLIDRSWFTAAVEKRWMMLDEYRFRLIDKGADIEELAAVEVVPDSVELPADSEFGNANAEVISTPVQTAPVLVSVTSSEPEPLLEPELGPQRRHVVPAAPSMLGKQLTPTAVVPALPKQKKKRVFSRLVSQSPYSLLG